LSSTRCQIKSGFAAEFEMMAPSDRKLSIQICSILQLTFGSYALASNTFGGDNNACGHGVLRGEHGRVLQKCIDNATLDAAMPH
jgi:hypothetical protein